MPLLEETPVTREAIGFEFMLNALRLTSGVEVSLFAAHTGYPISIVQREMQEALRRGLLDEDPTVIRATTLGRRFLNDLQGIFLRERDAGSPTAAAAGARVAVPPLAKDSP